MRTFCDKRERIFLRAAVLAAVLVCLLRAFCLTAHAESDSDYYCDGEGTYYIWQQTGGSLVCDGENLTPEIRAGSPGDMSGCTRFTLVPADGNSYRIVPVGAADAYLCGEAGGETVVCRKADGTVSPYGLWRVIPQPGGSVQIVNVGSGRYLCSYLTRVCAKQYRQLLVDRTNIDTAEWILVRGNCYGNYDEAPVREFRVEKSEIETAVSKSFESSFTEMFGFSWSMMSEAEDFTFESSDPGVIAVTEDGGMSAAGTGTAIVMAWHPLTKQRLTAEIRVCNNAIVIVPGMMGSELKNRSGEKIWSESLLDEISSNLSLSALSRLSDLSSPRSGDGIYAYDNFFGAFDIFKDMYRKLVTNYKNDYAIEFYAYDWRRSSAETGRDLANHLLNKGYDEIIFVTHSFGGLVLAQALAQSEALQEKTALACMIATPINGTPGLVQGWVDDCFGNLFGLGSFSSMENSAIRKIVGTLPSVYEMLPSEYAVTKLGMIGGCDNYETFLSACSKSMSSFDISLARNAAKTMSAIYQDGVCVLDKVPTLWYAGVGATTVCSANLSGNSFSFITTDQGDGVVALETCTVGLTKKPDSVYPVAYYHLWTPCDPGLIDDIIAKVAEHMPGGTAQSEQ